MVLEILCQKCRESLKSHTNLKDIEIKILQFIQNFQIKNKLSPSYIEIQQAVGIKSMKSLSKFLKNLKEKLYIDFIPAKPRGIKILRKDWQND